MCADFNEKRAYLVELDNDDVRIIHSLPTTIADGTPVETDLMDVKGTSVVVTNFYQGSLSFYEVKDDEIQFRREILANRYKGAHGVRFIPGQSDLLWVSYCGRKNKCLEIVDCPTGEVVHHVDLKEQAQDAAFLGGYAVQFARTDHILRGAPKRRFWQPLKKMYATAYLFRLPDDLRSDPPQLADEWRGTGHIDACKEFDGKVYAANQYNSEIDVFSIRGGRLEHCSSIPDFGMPHGLDIRKDGLMAVTNYADQSLRFINLHS